MPKSRNKNIDNILAIDLNEINADPFNDETLQIYGVLENSNESIDINNPILREPTHRPSPPIDANVIITNNNPSVEAPPQRVTISNSTPSLGKDVNLLKRSRTPKGIKKICKSKGKRMSLLKSLQTPKKRTNSLVKSIKKKYQNLAKNKKRIKIGSPQGSPRGSPRGSRSSSRSSSPERLRTTEETGRRRPTLAQILPKSATDIKIVDKDGKVLRKIPNRTCRHLLSHIGKKHATNRDNLIYNSKLQIRPLR